MKQDTDVYDGITAMGLVLLFVGLAWWFSTAISMAVTGSILLVLGVFLASRRG